MSNIKTANLNVSLKQLFTRWLDVTQAFHKLNNQEQKVLALLLYHHYILKKDITNNKILWKMVFDYDTKMKIKEDTPNQLCINWWDIIAPILPNQLSTVISGLINNSHLEPNSLS